MNEVCSFRSPVLDYGRLVALFLFWKPVPYFLPDLETQKLDQQGTALLGHPIEGVIF